MEVWAASALRAAYPFPFDRVVPAEALNRPMVVNQFDMLMIGGGGLLSPASPADNGGVANAITIPIAFIGIGAAADVVARSEILVKKAMYVSVRDDHSMSSMQRFIKHANFMPDPVLCDADYDIRAATLPQPARTAIASCGS